MNKNEIIKNAVEPISEVVSVTDLEVGDIIVCKVEHYGSNVDGPAHGESMDSMSVLLGVREVSDVEDWTMYQLRLSGFGKWLSPVFAHDYFRRIKR